MYSFTTFHSVTLLQQLLMIYLNIEHNIIPLNNVCIYMSVCVNVVGLDLFQNFTALILAGISVDCFIYKPGARGNLAGKVKN